MRVGVNLRMLVPGRIGGHEVYARELLRLLRECDPSLELVLFATPETGDSLSDASAAVVQLPAEEIADLTAADLLRHALDVWFCPLMILEPPTPGIPAVATIPDLQHEMYPHFFSDQELEWRRHWYGLTLRRADAVITVSEYSRRQMVRTYPHAAGRITVIPEAAPPPFDGPLSLDANDLEEVRRRYELPERFLFYPANNWVHKNHERLFEAVAACGRDLGEPPHLVLTGADIRPFGTWLLKLNELGLDERVHWLGHIPRHHLTAVFALARAMVFPSLYEGFGLPVLEAMAAGCPVACSAATSLPEVAGDAARYFDPSDADSMAEAIAVVWSDDEERARLVRSGRERHGQFEWLRTAEQTLEVLRRVAHPRHGDPVTVAGTHSGRPLVTVVTPSLNQGRYLRDAIDSVLQQDYPAVEYLVIDGGSTDDTVDILRSYGDRVRWVSEPDAGQSAAINKGFRLARGEVLAWLNSDDMLAPGAIRTAVDAFEAHPDVGLVYGRGGILDTHGRAVGPFTGLEPFCLWRLVYFLNFVLQPATFFRRDAVEEIGLLREELAYAMDWDLWIRLAAHTDVLHLPHVLGYSREYGDTKTSTGGWRRILELERVARRHSGRRWTPGVRVYAVETLKGKIETATPASLRPAVRAITTWLHIRAHTAIGVHVDGWLGPEAAVLIPRRWSWARIDVETMPDWPGAPYKTVLSAEGRVLAVLVIPRPGRYAVHFEVPRGGPRPLVEVRISTDWSRQDPPGGDPRRLALVCLAITRLEGSQSSASST